MYITIMFKIFLVIFLIFSININSQEDNITCVWTGNDYLNNTNWGNASNWDDCNGGYPSGNSAVANVKSGNSVNKTITLDRDITLKQFKHGGSYGGAWTLNQASGGSYTLTLTGNGATQVWQHNKNDVQWTINANVTVDAPTAGTKQIKIGDSSHSNNNSLTFSNTSTLTISADTHLKFFFNKVGHSVSFNGTISSGGNDRDFIFTDKHTVTFGSTVIMTNMGGDLLFYDDEVDGDLYNAGTAGAITVNGDVRAKQIKLSASNMTINVTGSLTSTNTSNASGNILTGGNGKIILKTSKSNSGSIIANTDNGGYKLDFVRTLDGDDEWTLIGVPVTDEAIQDVIDTGALRTGSGANSGKSALGYFDNSTGEYVYYSSTGNSANFDAGTGYILSPQGSGSQDVTFSGTTTTENTASYFAKTRESGAYGNYILVGNPYPAYVALNDVADSNTANNFLEQNTTLLHDSYEQVWGWNGSSWDTYNNTSNVVTHIAPGEAFFIYLRDGGDASGNVRFNESMKKTGAYRNFNTQVVRGAKTSEISYVKVKLVDLDTNESDKIKLWFSKNSTRGLDPGYDGGKFFAKNSAYLYTRLLEEDEGIDFDIQALPYSDLRDIIIPLGLETKSSRIQFSLFEKELSHLYNVFLEDRLLNKIMKLDNPIEISLDKEEKGMGRFYLHFTDGMIPELTTDDELRIFKSSENSIRIIGEPEKNYKAKIYDLSGRLINYKEFKHYSYLNDIDVKTIKILKIESDKKTVIKKFKIE